MLIFLLAYLHTYLTGYSDCQTGFREPLSRPSRSHTGLKNVQRDYWNIYFCIHTNRSKHAGSDPEAVWLRPVTAITASVQPQSGRIVYYARSDFPHPFQLRFFQRRHGPYYAKPTLIRSGWPGQGLAKRI